jgi:hypothetical protein
MKDIAKVTLLVVTQNGAATPIGHSTYRTICLRDRSLFVMNFLVLSVT